MDGGCIFTILYRGGTREDQYVILRLVLPAFHFFFVKFSVPRRGHPDDLGENGAEIVRVVISYDRGDPCDRMIG